MFGRKTQQKLDDIHSAVSHSFTKVRGDTSTLFEWIRYLHSRADTHQQALHALYDKHHRTLTREEAKELFEAQHLVRSFSKQLELLDARLQKLEGSQQKLLESKPMLPTAKVRQTPLQERIVKKVSQQSKDYIKKSILSLIEKYDQISGTQLREMVVEEQQLCSRSSYYRMLEELQKDGEVSSLSSGKEKLLVPNRKLFK